MADFLIQRFLNNPNEIRHDSGVWEDCFVVRGVTAAQAREAVEAAMGGVPPAVPGEDDRLRALRWDTMTQFDAPMGPRMLTPSDTPITPPAFTAGSA